MNPASDIRRRGALPLILLGLFAVEAAACGSTGSDLEHAGPTPLPAPSATALPAAQVTFTAIPPDGTPEDAAISLVVLDEVSGFAFNSVALDMERDRDGTWSLDLSLPAGMLLRYRYQRASPQVDIEHTASAEPVKARILQVTGSMAVEDIIASWGSPLPIERTGQLMGRITHAVDSTPLADQIVVAAGQWTFTDGEGAFRLENLPAGLQRITVFSTDGSFRPHQQGAIIETGNITPVEITLIPAETTRVTFEVTVPGDTLPGSPVRIAGNLRQFGHRFSELPGGTRGTIQDMPTMTPVDETHYLWIADLPVGTYLRYKYTLGDGIWNAERNTDGFFRLRHLIVPEHELVVRDTVSTWRGDHGSALIQVSVPPETPSQDIVSIQFNPASSASPLPMTQIGEHEWFFVLHGPQDFEAPLPYRYCRNMQCGIADEGDLSSGETPTRVLNLNVQGTTTDDVISAWNWWAATPEAPAIIAPEISPRETFAAGVEFSASYLPEWKPWIFEALKTVANHGANAVSFTPAWVVGRAGQVPTISFDPAFAPFRDEVIAFIQAAKGSDLSVTLRPTLVWPATSPDEWWMAARRDPDWWEAWFEHYHSFAISYASLAAEAGVQRLVLGGAEVGPALPDGLLPDGSPSGAPADVEGRWRSLIREIRGIYFGRLAFELELGPTLDEPPDFLSLFDEVHLHWHAPLWNGTDREPASMRMEASRRLEQVLEHPLAGSLPIILSVAYPSVAAGAAGCETTAEGECPAPTVSEQGAVDLEEQSLAMNAVLLAAYDRREVVGWLARGYNPVVALQDKSTSVHGKPAAEVLWYWFPRLTGREPSGGVP